MQNIINALKGKKTYIVAVAMGVIVGLNQMGVMDSGTMGTIINCLVATGLITLRASIPTK